MLAGVRRTRFRVGATAVSYTHLDVYKRQVIPYFRLTLLATCLVCALGSAGAAQAKPPPPAASDWIRCDADELMQELSLIHI